MYVFPFATTLQFPNNDDLTAILKFKTTCIASAQTAFVQTQACFCNYSKDGVSLLY